MRRCLLLLSALTLALAACDDGGAPGATASFTHGVAAGDVQATSAVLWTRAEGGDRVRVEVTAADATESRTFDGETSAARDDTVRIAASELAPDTRYTYRFLAGTAVSETGTFMTPPDDATSKPLQFVFSGDSDGTRDAAGAPTHNEFDVLRTAAEEDPAFFLYLGDTIYADRGEPASTLEEYRAKYRANREYEALAMILGQTSVVAMWDDHEVVNDYAGQVVVDSLLRAALRAFREWMPIDTGSGISTLHRSLSWGKDVELIMLDTRAFRDASAAMPCENDPLPAGAAPAAPETLRGVRQFAELPATLALNCIETLDDPARSMLGAEQKEFLFERLRESAATWKIVATSVPMQALLFAPYDRWEGYPAERREVLEFIRDNGVKNFVFLSTDLHANIFGPVRIDPFAETAPIAYEAIAGPIAAETLEKDIVNVLGEGGAGLLGAFLTGIVGVDCAQLDSFAYGLVEVVGGTLTITAKDETGRELCAKTLEAE